MSNPPNTDKNDIELLFAIITDKIKKEENISIDDKINTEIINKYYPKIKKALPYIFHDTKQNKTSNSNDVYHKLFDKNNNHQTDVHKSYIPSKKSHLSSDDCHKKDNAFLHHLIAAIKTINVILHHLIAATTRRNVTHLIAAIKTINAIRQIVIIKKINVIPLIVIIKKINAIPLIVIIKKINAIPLIVIIKKINAIRQIIIIKRINAIHLRVIIKKIKDVIHYLTIIYLQHVMIKKMFVDHTKNKSDSWNILSSPDESKSDIDERIKKVKTQLDKISSSDENINNNNNDKIHIEHTKNDKDNKGILNWIYSNDTDKISKHDNNEELDAFRKKIIKKAELIISCYKKKLLEYVENKNTLENSLSKSHIENKKLNEKLQNCHESLKQQEKQKVIIMDQVSKCEKDLAILLDKYSILKNDYMKKKNIYETSNNKSSKMLAELDFIKKELKKYDQKKISIKNLVNNLQKDLNVCKQNKINLLKTNDKLKLLIKKCNNENVKYSSSIKELKEQIHKLDNKLHITVKQNKELGRENYNLKDELSNAHQTLKLLNAKYSILKKKCERKTKKH